MDDVSLLREFVARRSQSAFRQLVERHTNLVYACALQRLRDVHAAQDVTQAVFLTLALKAKDLRPERPLAGWLFVTAGYVAGHYQRGEQRRKEREMRAVEHQIHADSPSSPAWEDIQCHLHAGLESLGATDRTALLLRFYENASHREIGSALQMSEETAKKRVNRALEKLRCFLTKKGVVLSATGLAGTLTAHVAAAAPPGLAATVSAAVLAGVSGTLASTTSTLMLAKGALHAMFIAKAKTVGLAAAACLVVVGSGVVVANQLAASTPSTTVVAIGPVTTPPRTLAGSPAGSLGAQSTPAKPVEPVQTTVPAIGIQRATSSGPSLAQLIQHADWIVAGTVTAHVKGAGDKPKPAAFKIKVDETVLQPKALLPAEIEVKPYIPLNLRRASLYAQPPIGSLNGDIPNTWQEPPAIGALVVVFGSATGCNWAEFANATDREAFVQRLRGYLDGSIHKQLAVELLQPAPADLPTDYTKPHPAIALCDLEVLGHSGDGPAIIRYAKQFEQEQQAKVAGNEVPGHFFDLDRANQIVSTLVAVGERGDDAARQFAAELVTRGQQFASNGAEGTLWASLGRWGRTDVAPQAIEIFRKNPWRTASGTDFSRGYFPALKQAAPEQYNKVRTQVTDPTLGQLLDALVADTKQ